MKPLIIAGPNCNLRRCLQCNEFFEVDPGTEDNLIFCSAQCESEEDLLDMDNDIDITHPYVD